MEITINGVKIVIEGGYVEMTLQPDGSFLLRVKPEVEKKPVDQQADSIGDWLKRVLENMPKPEPTPEPIRTYPVYPKIEPVYPIYPWNQPTTIPMPQWPASPEIWCSTSDLRTRAIT